MRPRIDSNPSSSLALYLPTNKEAKTIMIMRERGELPEDGVPGPIYMTLIPGHQWVHGSSTGWKGHIKRLLW